MLCRFSSQPLSPPRPRWRSLSRRVDTSPKADLYSLTLGIGGGIAPEYEGASDYGFQPGGIIRARSMALIFRSAGPISMST